MGDLSDAFYQRAKEHFERLLPPATIVADKRTLADIIGHVNAAGKPVDTLYIVSHGLESGTLMFSIDPADLAKDSGSGDARPRTELGELKAANGAGALPPADTSLIDVETKIEIKGCSVGRSELMLAELDVALGGKGNVTAPTHAQQFEPNDAGVFEETFGDLFIEEAGVAVKSDAELAAAFPTKYPMVPEGNWQALLQKVTTHNRSELRYRYAERNPPNDDETSVLADETVVAKFPASAGWVLTYKGRTTVGDQYHYEVVGERVREDGNTESYSHVITASIPPEEAALIEQEKAKHARPDAYKWSVRRTVTGSQLTLEVFAEATEWTIEATIEDASGPHHPAHNDSTFFESSTATPPAPRRAHRRRDGRAADNRARVRLGASRRARMSAG